MNSLGQLLAGLLDLFRIVLIGRLVFEYIQIFSRHWRPRGAVMVLAEFIYTLTDPPLRVLRQWIKPIRLGSISLDLAFLVLFIGTGLLASILRGL